MKTQDAMKFVDVRGPDECWEWQGGKYTTGYGVVNLPNGKQEKAHRTVYKLVRGDIPKGMNVCHKCDNPPCCNPHHLFLGTQKDNLADMTKKGRRRNGRKPGDQDGEKNPNSKLSKQDVIEIRYFLTTKRTHQQIADMYGVSRATVSLIKENRTWKELSCAQSQDLQM